MKPNPLADLRPLAYPADIELRSALAVLLRRLLADPGSLFNPLYVGPLRDADLLTEVLHHAAGEAGLRIVSLSELGGREAAQSGVTLLSERDAARVARYGNRPSGGLQVVIWGRQPAAALSTGVQEWVETGLSFDPGVDSGSHEPRPVAEAVGRLARPEAQGPRAAIWVGAPGQDAEAVTEVRLRWALETNQAIPDLVLPAEESALARVTGGAILRLSGAAGPEGAAQAWRQARALMARGVAVFLTTDPVGEAALRLPTAGGPTPDEVQWLWNVPPAHAPEETIWPSLAHALVGRPEFGRRRDGTVEISLHDTTLIEVLRGAVGWPQAGTFVVFESGRLGLIQVANGEIRGARRVQERQEAGTAAETVARVRDIARWPHARVFFVPRDGGDGAWGTGCRLPLDTLVFDLTTAGRGSTGFASFEQPAAEVGAALARLGLVAEAVSLLRDPKRQAEMEAGCHFLLGHLRAASTPGLALESFRAAVQDAVDPEGSCRSRDLALDAGLNALLVEVRGGVRSSTSAWRVVEECGLADPAALADSPDRVAIVLELASRVDDRETTARLARWLVDRGAGGELPGRLLRRLGAEPSLAPDAASAPADLSAELVLAGGAA